MNNTAAQKEIILKENNVSQEDFLFLENCFKPFFEDVNVRLQNAETIVVKSIEDTSLMKKAKEERLFFKDIRVSVEKKRKELKEDSLRKGKAIDGFANLIKSIIEPVEEHLEKQEKFLENMEKEKKDILEKTRKESMLKYNVDIQFYNFRDMPEDTFIDLLGSSKKNYELRLKEQERLELEAKQKKAKEDLEIENTKKENEKLKQESIIKDQELKKEKEERQRLESEKQKEAERILSEKKETERLEKETLQKKYKMSDTEKIAELCKIIESIQTPNVLSDCAKNLVDEVKMTICDLIIKIKKY